MEIKPMQQQAMQQKQQQQQMVARTIQIARITSNPHDNNTIALRAKHMKPMIRCFL